MSDNSENVAAKAFTIFIVALVIGIIVAGSAGWIIAFIASIGYAITKKKS